MDGPSADPGSAGPASETERHSGALFFGYFLLGKQKKVTRQRAETRIKKLPRSGLESANPAMRGSASTHPAH
jgi:hypothetical protein